MLWVKSTLLLGVKFILLLGVRSTLLLGVKSTLLLGVKSTLLIGVKSNLVLGVKFILTFAFLRAGSMLTVRITFVLSVGFAMMSVVEFVYALKCSLVTGIQLAVLGINVALMMGVKCAVLGVVLAVLGVILAVIGVRLLGVKPALVLGVKPALVLGVRSALLLGVRSALVQGVALGVKAVLMRVKLALLVGVTVALIGVKLAVMGVRITPVLGVKLAVLNVRLAVLGVPVARVGIRFVLMLRAVGVKPTPVVELKFGIRATTEFDVGDSDRMAALSWERTLVITAQHREGEEGGGRGGCYSRHLLYRHTNSTATRAHFVLWSLSICLCCLQQYSLVACML